MNDILKSINLRLNNPFILSFCISWIFWNWPVVVGLIWYNSTTIEKFGYTDYKDLIQQNANPWKNYVLPAVFAIAYPFAKWFFAWIQTWVASKEEKTIKVVSGKGFIPTSKYLSVIDQYDNDIKKLSDIIEKESDLQNENSRLLTEKSELTTKLLSSNSRIDELVAIDNKLRRIVDRNVFNDFWRLTIIDYINDVKLETLLDISNGIGKVYKDREYTDEEIFLYDYFCNPYSLRSSLELIFTHLNKNSLETDRLIVNDISWDSEKCEKLETTNYEDRKERLEIYFKMERLRSKSKAEKL